LPLVTTTVLHFGMLEAHALQGVVQLHVHAEVVGVELELVAGLDAAVFVDVERQRGDGAVAGKAPVLVLRRGWCRR
jgi:hypothetical protein